MAEKERKLPASATSPETEEYWAAAKDGKLLVKKCTACGKTHHYPRTLCPFCFSDKTEWVEASGRGTIYSYSVMRRAPVPYAMAYVTLAEGPRDKDAVVAADLNLDVIDDVRSVWQFYRDRRPDAYGPLVQP